MSDLGRHTRYHNYRSPKDKRVRRLYGEKDDANRWYRCWNCGFAIDSDSTAHGGTGSGINYTISIDIDFMGSALTGDETKAMTPFGGGFALMEQGPDGTDKSIYITYAPESGTGCSLCGTKNWK